MRWLPVVSWAVLLAGGALLVTGLHRYVPPCVFRELTGLYCPGCGSGRALVALSRLDVAGALRSNPLAVAALPFVLAGLVRETATAWGVPVPRLATPRWLPNAVLTAIIVFWLLRNVPTWPFVLLAPH